MHEACWSKFSPGSQGAASEERLTIALGVYGLFMLAKVFLGKPCSRDLGGLAAEAKLLPAPPAESQLHSWDGLDGEGIFMNDKTKENGLKLK